MVLSLFVTQEPRPNTLYSFTETLNRCTSYSFKISDSFGDGFIDPGAGNVEVRHLKEALGRIGGNFGSESSILFYICDIEPDN